MNRSKIQVRKLPKTFTRKARIGRKTIASVLSALESRDFDGSGMLSEMIGWGLLKTKNWSQAERAFRLSNRRGKPKPRRLVHLAEIFRHQGRIFEEIEVLKRAARLNPRYKDLHLNLGNAQESMSRFEKAADSFREAIKHDERSSLAYYRLGYCLELLNDEGSVKNYEKAIELAEEDEASHLGIGVFHERREYWPEAAHAYETHAEVGEHSAEAYLRAGTCYERYLALKDAERCYKRSLESCPQKTSQTRLGVVLEMQGRHEEAIVVFRSLANRDDESPQATYRLGLNLYKSGQAREAADTFSKLWHWYPEARPSESVERAEARIYATGQHEPTLYLALGDALRVEGDVLGACSAYTEFNASQRPPSKCAQRSPWEHSHYCEYREDLKSTKTTVLYESTAACTEYISSLVEALKRDEKWAAARHVWVSQVDAKVPENVRKDSRVLVVPQDTDAYRRLLATAAVIVSDAHLPNYYARTDQQHHVAVVSQEHDHFELSELFKFPPGKTRNLLQATLILSESERSQLLQQAPILERSNCEIWELGNVESSRGSAVGERLEAKLIEFLNSAAPANSAARSDKKDILLHAGALKQNGITTSAVNLTLHLDDETNVTLVIDPRGVLRETDRKEALANFSKRVRLLGRVGQPIATRMENQALQTLSRHRSPPSEAMWQQLRQFYTREYQRLFGGAEFNVAVNFAGYDLFWHGVLSAAPARRAVFLHANMYAEWTVKYPRLESIFRLYREYDALLSVSEQTGALNKRELAERFELEPKKFDYCDNVHNPERVSRLADEPLSTADQELVDGDGPLFITMGRLSVEKDHAKLIRSFSPIAEMHPGARLLILGDGPLKDALQQQTRNLGCQKQILLLGHRPNPFAFLRQADCFVLSSNHEGQPMVLFEALILGLPIVSTDIVGSRSVMEGRPGLLVENSEDGLRRGMLEMIQNGFPGHQFKIDDYQSTAIKMFYQKVLGATPLRSECQRS